MTGRLRERRSPTALFDCPAILHSTAILLVPLLFLLSGLVDATIASFGRTLRNDGDSLRSGSRNTLALRRHSRKPLL
jgi:hypothetical protein